MERLQRSATYYRDVVTPNGPVNLELTRLFNRDVLYCEVTLTVLVVTPHMAQQWENLVARVKVTTREVARAGPHPISGKPRTISYRVRGTAAELNILIGCPQRPIIVRVDSWEVINGKPVTSDARIAHRGTGATRKA